MHLKWLLTVADAFSTRVLQLSSRLMHRVSTQCKNPRSHSGNHHYVLPLLPDDLSNGEILACWSWPFRSQVNRFEVGSWPFERFIWRWSKMINSSMYWSVMCLSAWYNVCILVVLLLPPVFFSNSNLFESN